MSSVCIQRGSSQVLCFCLFSFVYPRMVTTILYLSLYLSQQQSNQCRCLCFSICLCICLLCIQRRLNQLRSLYYYMYFYLSFVYTTTVKSTQVFRKQLSAKRRRPPLPQVCHQQFVEVSCHCPTLKVN